MRKVLFRILIIISLSLMIILGIAYYKDKTPLSVIQWWFGVQQDAVVIVTQQAEEQKKVDTTEKIKEMVTEELVATWHSSSTLSEQDKKDMKALVDGLVEK